MNIIHVAGPAEAALGPAGALAQGAGLTFSVAYRQQVAIAYKLLLRRSSWLRGQNLFH